MSLLFSHPQSPLCNRQCVHYCIITFEEGGVLQLTVKLFYVWLHEPSNLLLIWRIINYNYNQSRWPAFVYPFILSPQGRSRASCPHRGPSCVFISSRAWKPEIHYQTSSYSLLHYLTAAEYLIAFILFCVCHLWYDFQRQRWIAEDKELSASKTGALLNVHIPLHWELWSCMWFRCLKLNDDF